MSDMKINPFPQYKNPKEWAKNVLKPESVMDLLDPGQHFQGEEFSEELVEEKVKKAETEEKEKIKQEGLETNRKKLEAQRKLRREGAARKGRAASIMTGALGTKDEPEVRRATLG